MIPVAIYISVTLLVYYLVPKFIEQFTHKTSIAKSLLLLGGFLFLIAQFLPSPNIEGRDTQFVTHVVGGGLYSGFIWTFLKTNFRWRFGPFLDLLGLFFLTSGLGAANEIYELAAVKLGLFHISLTDTSWDILANTIGALIFWVVYHLPRK